jgi:PAS domain-containing protein
MSVMIETIGSRNLRWLRRKRDYFLSKSNATTKLDRVGRIRTNAANAAAAAANGSGVGGSRTSMPHSIVRQNSRLQHAISSLSSSSESGHSSSREDLRKVESMSRRNKRQTSSKHRSAALAAKKVSCSGSSNQLSSSSNDTRQQTQQEQQQQQQGQSNDYHDYHAPSLLEPLPESSDSVASDNCVVGKHMLASDSSSEDDDTDPKKQKVTETSGTSTSTGDNASKPAAAAAGAGSRSVASIPSNIARSGIAHSVKVLPSAASLPNGHAQLARAPAVALPPFAGIGKKSSAITTVGVRSGSSSSSSVEPSNNQSVASTAPTAAAVASHNANNNNSIGGQPSVLLPNQIRGPSANYLHPQSTFIAIDNDTTSSSSMEASREIQAYYHLNEDDMILTDNVLMCPFIFRSQDAVLCGALSECVMPGMLRACFGPTNKLSNVEMIFDAMGFCQQLERASGNDSLAQIIPNSLEMALSPISDEVRVITLSKAPFPIVSVNEAWTRVTGYTQVDVEGKDLSILNGRETKENSSDIESVAKGQCSCSVNVHYDVNGRDFFSFVCSYPLTNLNDEVTHLLHIFQELPARE